MRYEIPFLLVCSVTVLQCMGSSRRDAQITNLKAPRDDSYSVLESGSTLEVGQGDDGRICETLLNFKEVCHFSRRSSPPSSFCPGSLATLRQAQCSFTSLTKRIDPQYRSQGQRDLQRRASNALDLKSIASTLAPACDIRPGHARAVNLTADPR